MRLPNYSVIDRIHHLVWMDVPRYVNGRFVAVFWAACATLCISSNAAEAANCSAYPYPYTLTNGTAANADQVMGNFNNILGCANNSLAPLANPLFTGKIGIGTASPTYMLDAYAASGDAIFRAKSASSGSAILWLDRATTSTAQTSGIYFLSAGSHDFSLGLAPGDANASDLSIYNYGTDSNVLTIRKSNSYVGVGTTVPGYLFHVNGPVAAAAFVTTSDARLKKDVSGITGALSLVQKLRGVSFIWKPANEREVGQDLKLPANERQLGFIAQEVAAVVPEAVVAPAKGSNAPYALKEADLIPLLVEAIKEQQVEIEQLRASLKAIAVSSQR